MRLIGNTIPKVAHWPLGVDSISAAMQTLDTAYHMNHRGGEIGHYAFSQKEENSGMFTCDNPYPCDFDMGIIEGLSYLIKDENISIQITHDEGACRKDGFEDCVYWVTWKKC